MTTGACFVSGLAATASPAYGVYISQLIRYARASSNYSDFLKRHPSQFRHKDLTRLCFQFQAFPHSLKVPQNTV
jgi:hypothetical protein